MDFYSACLVFEVKNHHQSAASFFEESWILLRASDEHQARIQAHQAGAVQEESFLNHHNELITWNFMGFRQVQKLTMDEPTTEIFSISKKTPGFVESLEPENQSVKAAK